MASYSRVSVNLLNPLHSLRIVHRLLSIFAKFRSHKIIKAQQPRELNPAQNHKFIESFLSLFLLFFNQSTNDCYTPDPFTSERFTLWHHIDVFYPFIYQKCYPYIEFHKKGSSIGIPTHSNLYGGHDSAQKNRRQLSPGELATQTRHILQPATHSILQHRKHHPNPLPQPPESSLLPPSSMCHLTLCPSRRDISPTYPLQPLQTGATRLNTSTLAFFRSSSPSHKLTLNTHQQFKILRHEALAIFISYHQLLHN